MEKAVMISIRPEWVEKILSGEKTLEIRKNGPNLETPFKCYIYCTKAPKGWLRFSSPPVRLDTKVVAEFTCDKISQYEAELWDDKTHESICEIYKPDDFDEYGELEHRLIAQSNDPNWGNNPISKASCVSVRKLRKYLGTGFHEFTGWHISGLKIYDQPKDLGEFYKAGTLNASDFEYQLYDGSGDPSRRSYASYLFTKALRMPPQSWCYVEDVL